MYTLDFLSLDLTVGPLKLACRFYVIDSWTAYHLLLGRSWIHRHKSIPSLYHQCLEAILKVEGFTVMPQNLHSREMGPTF